jgi:hypothetical protein
MGYNYDMPNEDICLYSPNIDPIFSKYEPDTCLALGEKIRVVELKSESMRKYFSKNDLLQVKNLVFVRKKCDLPVMKMGSKHDFLQLNEFAFGHSTTSHP